MVRGAIHVQVQKNGRRSQQNDASQVSFTREHAPPQRDHRPESAANLVWLTGSESEKLLCDQFGLGTSKAPVDDDVCNK